jgi:hypothetical protein
MTHKRTLLALVALLLVLPGRGNAYRLADTKILVPPQVSPLMQLAADELRRYVFLLTSTLPLVAVQGSSEGTAIVLRSGAGNQLSPDGPDPQQNHSLYQKADQQIVHGASDAATLWAAYRLIESWGVGFYLGGDALPPVNPEMEVEFVQARYVPALKIRGNLPWFNFLNSPTTWNPQDYKSFLSQMVKQRANFIGFHVYDHEPFCGYDFSTLHTRGSAGWPDAAASGGPLMNTTSPHRWWSPPAMATGDFLFGTHLFFDRGEWGCEVGIDDAWAYHPARAVQLQ